MSNYGLNFMRPKEVVNRLGGIHLNTLRCLLAPYLHHLSTLTGTAFYSRIYTDAVALEKGSWPKTKQRGLTKLVEDFAQTEEAAYLVKRAERSYRSALEARLDPLATGQLAIKATDIASLLDLGKTTVGIWVSAGKLPAYDGLGELRQSEHGLEIHVLAEDFERFCQWHSPTQQPPQGARSLPTS